MSCFSQAAGLQMPNGFDCQTFDAVNALISRYSKTHERGSGFTLRLAGKP